MNRNFVAASMFAGLITAMPLLASNQEEHVLIDPEDEKPLLQYTLSEEHLGMIMAKLKQEKVKDGSCLTSLHQCALEAHMPEHLVPSSEGQEQKLTNCLCVFAGNSFFLVAGLLMQQAIDADISRVIAVKWVSTVILGMTAIILQCVGMKNILVSPERLRIKNSLEVFIERINAQREDGRRSITIDRNEGNYVVSIYSSELVSAIKELLEKMRADISRLSAITSE